MNFDAVPEVFKVTLKGYSLIWFCASFYWAFNKTCFPFDLIGPEWEIVENRMIPSNAFVFSGCHLINKDLKTLKRNNGR